MASVFYIVSCLTPTTHGYASLLVQDGNDVNNCLLSKEGETQGDPLSMMLPYSY